MVMIISIVDAYDVEMGILENELERGNINVKQFNKRVRKMNLRFGISNDID